MSVLAPSHPQCLPMAGATSQNSTDLRRCTGCAIDATRASLPTSPWCAQCDGTSSCCGTSRLSIHSGTPLEAPTIFGRLPTTRGRATPPRRSLEPLCWCIGGEHISSPTAHPNIISGACGRTRRACTVGRAATTRAKTSCFLRGGGRRPSWHRPTFSAQSKARRLLGRVHPSARQACLQARGGRRRRRGSGRAFFGRAFLGRLPRPLAGRGQ